MQHIAPTELCYSLYYHSTNISPLSKPVYRPTGFSFKNRKKIEFISKIVCLKIRIMLFSSVRSVMFVAGNIRDYWAPLRRSPFGVGAACWFFMSFPKNSRPKSPQSRLSRNAGLLRRSEGLSKGVLRTFGESLRDKKAQKAGDSAET